MTGGNSGPRPHFGIHHGIAVHRLTWDHLPSRTKLDRFNARLAVAISKAVGSMWCAYVFCLIALVSLPATLTLAGITPHGFFPKWLIAVGLIALVAWVAQTFLQLVLLSVIMVGQDVLGKASDARAAKTFEDAERLLDLLDTRTEGGIKTVLDRLDKLTGLPDEIAVLADVTRAVLAARGGTATKKAGT